MLSRRFEAEVTESTISLLAYAPPRLAHQNGMNIMSFGKSWE